MISIYRNSKEKNCETASKKIIISICETLIETPMEIPTNNSHKTAWSSINTLKQKDLVICPKKGQYALTKKGRKLARRLHRAEKELEGREFSWQETDEELSSSSSEEEDNDSEEEEETMVPSTTSSSSQVASQESSKTKKKKAPSKRSKTSQLSELRNSSSQLEFSSQEFDADLDLDLFSQSSQPSSSSNHNHYRNYNEMSRATTSYSSSQELFSDSQQHTSRSFSATSSECPIFCIDSDDSDEDASDNDEVEIFYDYDHCPLKLTFLDDRNKEVSKIEKCKFGVSTSGCPVLMIQCKYPREIDQQCKKLLSVIFDYEPQIKECDGCIIAQGQVHERRLEHVKEIGRDLLKALIVDEKLLPTSSTSTTTNTSTTKRINEKKKSNENSSQIDLERTTCEKDKTTTPSNTQQLWSEPCNPVSMSCQTLVLSNLDLETVPPFNPESSSLSNAVTSDSHARRPQKNQAKKRKEILFDDDDENAVEPHGNKERENTRRSSGDSGTTIMPPPSYIPPRNFNCHHASSAVTIASRQPSEALELSNDHPINFADYMNGDHQQLTTNHSQSANNNHGERREHYKIKLIVDQRERTGRGSDRKQFCEKLCRAGIDAEVSQLGLGDMIWIAQQVRSPNNNNNNSNETTTMDMSNAHVLDIIVERKDINDLAASIKDGRYREQKFRLNQSGCSNVFYLIEREFKDQDQLSCTSLETVVCKMIAEGIGVKHTPSLETSITFLQHLNTVLCELINENGVEPYKLMVVDPLDGQRRFNPTVAQYNQMFSKKNFEVTKKEIFARQLQAVDRCSAQVAESITNIFPTHRSLSAAFAKHGESALENVPLISAIDHISTKRVGKSLSKRLYQEFTQQ